MTESVGGVLDFHQKITIGFRNAYQGLSHLDRRFFMTTPQQDASSFFKRINSDDLSYAFNETMAEFLGMMGYFTELTRKSQHNHLDKNLCIALYRCKEENDTYYKSFFSYSSHASTPSDLKNYITGRGFIEGKRNIPMAQLHTEMRIMTYLKRIHWDKKHLPNRELFFITARDVCSSCVLGLEKWVKKTKNLAIHEISFGVNEREFDPHYVSTRTIARNGVLEEDEWMLTDISAWDIHKKLKKNCRSKRAFVRPHSANGVVRASHTRIAKKSMKEVLKNGFKRKK